MEETIYFQDLSTCKPWLGNAQQLEKIRVDQRYSLPPRNKHNVRHSLVQLDFGVLRCHIPEKRFVANVRPTSVGGGAYLSGVAFCSSSYRS